MPASTPRSPSRGGPRRSRPRRALHGEDAGVAEVIGYLLVFGILSVVLVLSMSAFGVAQEGAKERVVQLRAESASARVAGVVVQTAILAEKQGSGTAVAYLVDLPDQLEGLDYTVALEPKAGADPDRVIVRVPATGALVTSPVFAAGASSSVNLCDITVGGGAIHVRINAPAAHMPPTDPAHHGDHPQDVPLGCGADEVFLEVA